MQDLKLKPFSHLMSLYSYHMLAVIDLESSESFPTEKNDSK